MEFSVVYNQLHAVHAQVNSSIARSVTITGKALWIDTKLICPERRL
jgi:hypothetical protein